MEFIKQSIPLCHLCQWGAKPGKFRCCVCPGLTEFERYTLPPVAVVTDNCARYTPRKPINAA